MMDIKQTIEVLQNMIANADGDELIARRSAIDAVIQVRAFVESDKWILVEDALPEDDGAVLVTISGKAGNIHFDHAIVTAEYCEGEGWCIDPFDFELKGAWVKVYAWQPLPEPYGGKK